jgi:signal transduction histidine kinase
VARKKSEPSRGGPRAGTGGARRGGPRVRKRSRQVEAAGQAEAGKPKPGGRREVVVHLSPQHESHLAGLLQPQVRMQVLQATETTPLKTNCDYVIPPNANLSAIDTHLRLTALERTRAERAPIIAKHSGADSASVTLKEANDELLFGISDRGKCFDVSAVLGEVGRKSSIGLMNVSERIGLLGGRIQIESRPGIGTNVTLRLPKSASIGA